mmetsp:Transcript_2330/g.4708  ORF Transcript_2330/g.4708 Transcript_2330/m.4708 type:complete len:130 (-) Transcript_2330:134-523(-)
MKFTIAIAFALLEAASAVTPERRRTNMIDIPRVLEEKVTHEVEEYDPNLGMERELQGSMSMSMPDDGAEDGEVDGGDNSDGGDSVEDGGEDVGDGEDGGDGEMSASSASAFAISGIVSTACAVAAYGLI